MGVLRGPPPVATSEDQRLREQAQRDAALGKRLASMREGHTGPAIRRWVNADVAPMGALLRDVARSYLAGDMGVVAELLDTPTAEITTGEKPLTALMEWCLRGKSPGRVSEDATHADDIALAFMATAIHRLASVGGATDKPNAPKPVSHTVSAVLALCADAVRDTVLGQFITSIQGASAMQAVRERSPELWQQKKSLNRICARLVSQVKPQLLEEQAGERVLKTTGHRKVLSVVDHKGESRMLSLVPPDAVAWEVMSLCWAPEGSAKTSQHRPVWLALAAILLACAQRVGGWFDITETRTRRQGHTRKHKLLVLSEKAHAAIKRDADMWVSCGFNAEPMVVPPVDGDYLTVKHRKVNGQRPPLNLATNPEETTPWLSGACALANTPWTVNPHALSGADPSADPLTSTERPAQEVMREAAHRRLGLEPFYLPVSMDFRGRIYYRPTWVTPQSGDLGKSLLCFPREGDIQEGRPLGELEWADWWMALALHFSGLYGGPDKVDKKDGRTRAKWFQDALSQGHPVYEQADKPLTLRANWELMERGETDRIPIQLDGTCNGLQHLSALFRDEEGAKHVNLVRSTLEDAPADIYGHVAGITLKEFNTPTSDTGYGWRLRLEAAQVKIDRKLCKGPVMVLPYGGTREAVRLAVKASVLEQLLASYGDQKTTPWHLVKEDQYGAFSDRDLADHPLFNQDVGALAGLIWDSISPAIPRAMAAMQTLQAIGGWVGERGLSWRVGVGPEEKRLWVTQAKSKAARKQVTMRGFHLPALVRRLTLNAHSNEVDPKAHRTGIVANFIHSQDAAHLAASVAMFRAAGGGCVGSVHDCVMVRPSEAALMGRCLRDAFVELYEIDPLSQPVRTLDGDGGYVEYDDWHALAEAASTELIAAGKPGVAFPGRGGFDIREVKESAWFFS